MLEFTHGQFCFDKDHQTALAETKITNLHQFILNKKNCDGRLSKVAIWYKDRRHTALILINMPIDYCSGCRRWGPVGGGTRDGQGGTVAHWEGLPTAAQPGRRSTMVVAGLRGWRRRRRGRRGAGCWCRACGGEVGGRWWLEMATRVEAVPRRRRRWRLDGWRFPELLVVAEWGSRGGRVGWGPGTEAVASKESWNGGSGAGTVVVTTVCEGNKNLHVIKVERQVLNL
jgi:hypothetical protein